MSGRADGSVNFDVNLNLDKGYKDLEKMKGKINKTAEDIEDMTSKRDSAKEQAIFQGAELDEEKRKLAELKAQLVDLQKTAKDKTLSLDVRQEVSDQVPILRQDVAEQQQRVNALQREWNATEASVERYDQRIAEANANLSRQVDKAANLEVQLASASSAANAMPAAVEHMAAAMGKFTDRVIKLASRVFVFTLITKALRALRTWIGNAIQGNEEAQRSIAQLKGALTMLAQPILNVVIPAFVTLVNILTKVIMAIARVVSLIFGSNIAKSASQAKKSLSKEAEAISDVGEAAEEAAGSLAGFDEINSINTEPTGGSTGGGASAGGDQDTGIQPDFASLIDTSLDAIVELFAGLGLLALGAILAFTGVNIPLGIGLMAVGAALLADAVTANWSALSQQLQGPMRGITILVSGFLLAVGAVLAFTGIKISLGIALMAVGAAGLVTVVAANWNTITQLMAGPLGVIAALAGGAILAIGLVLALSGIGIGVGLAMMAAGAALLYASKDTDWGWLKEKLAGVWAGIVTWWNGSVAPYLSIEFWKQKGRDIVESIMEKLRPIKQRLSGIWQGIMSWWDTNVAKYFTLEWWADLGSRILDGIGKGLSDALTRLLNVGSQIKEGVKEIFDNIKEDVTDAWASLKKKLSEIITYVVGTFQSRWNSAWASIKSAFSSLWSGVSGIVRGGINTALGAVESFINSIVRVVNGVLSGVDWIAKVFGKSVSYRVNYVSVPRLAQGAVIPPNREFLAVLGDQSRGNNIEAPEALLRQIVREETGAGDGTAAILRDILSAVRAGQVITVDRQVLGRTAVRAINDLTGQAGRSVLKV